MNGSSLQAGNRIRVGRKLGTVRLVTPSLVWYHRDDDGKYTCVEATKAERVHGNTGRRV